MNYFSDRQNGSKARSSDEITPEVWGGIVAIVQAASKSGGFGLKFPENCPDGQGPVGTDESLLSQRLRAEIPELEWPLQTILGGGGYFDDKKPFAPDTLIVLDLIEFCYRSIAKPIQGSFHSFFKHHHLTFDDQAGKDEFRESINLIFSRNGLVYELSKNGEIIRLVPDVLQEALARLAIKTGDLQLDRMLEEAKQKFLNPKQSERAIGLEKLWDCWERLKSSENPSNKKISVAMLLEKAASEIQFREMLNREAKELTDIGNSFHIRHAEVTQQLITSSSHIDYLFHRLYSMILLLLRK